MGSTVVGFIFFCGYYGMLTFKVTVVEYADFRIIVKIAYFRVDGKYMLTFRKSSP